MSWQDLWGAGEDVSPPSVRVTDDRALRIDAVWACVRLLSDGIAAAPLQTFRSTPAGDVRVDAPPLVARPSRRVTTYDWLVQAVVSMCLRGNAYGVLLDWDAGVPTRCEWLHPDRVQVLDDGMFAPPRYSVGGQIFTAAEMLHIRGMTLPGALVGLSPIGYAAATIGRADAARTFSSQFLSGGAHPTGVLQTDQRIDGEQAKALKDRFVAALRGTREPVVLGAGTTFAALQVSPSDSQFLETEQWTVGQIARMYGVPPEMIGAATEGSAITYANVEQRTINLNAWTFRPWARRIELAISARLADTCRFNLDAHVRTDLKTRYEAHEIGIRAGFLSPDEAREYEHRPPIPGGSTFLWPRPQAPARENT